MGFFHSVKLVHVCHLTKILATVIKFDALGAKRDSFVNIYPFCRSKWNGPGYAPDTIEWMQYRFSCFVSAFALKLLFALRTEQPPFFWYSETMRLFSSMKRWVCPTLDVGGSAFFNSWTTSSLPVFKWLKGVHFTSRSENAGNVLETFYFVPIRPSFIRRQCLLSKMRDAAEVLPRTDIFWFRDNDWYWSGDTTRRSENYLRFAVVKLYYAVFMTYREEFP